MKRITFVFVSVAAVGLLGMLLIPRLTRRPPVLPNPNGHDRLLTAARMMPDVSVDLSAMEPATLRRFVESNSAVLTVARSAFSNASMVPLQPSQAWFTAHSLDLMRLKRLVWLFKAEGLVAEQDRDYAGAMRSYLDSIRMGRVVSRGGLLIDHLVGSSCQTIGVKPLGQISNGLSFIECRAAVGVLEDAIEEWEPLDKLTRDDIRFMRRISPPWEVLKSYFPWENQREFGIVMAEDGLSSARQTLGRITLQLASRCYQLQEGASPPSIQELIPRYLKRVPVDPSTGKPIDLAPVNTNSPVK